MTKAMVSGVTRRAAVISAGAGAMLLGSGRGADAQAITTRYVLTAANGTTMLQSYADAVKKMKDPSINNPPQPQSWTFQAYIHGVPKDPSNPVQSPGLRHGTAALNARINQIYGSPAPNTPKYHWKQAALACWGTCPHGSPWFVAWHRWYVLYLEQICRMMSGNTGFTLPYWNYASNQGNTLQLPGLFQQHSSALYESLRGLGFGNPAGTGPQNVAMNSNGYMPYSQTTYDPAMGAKLLFPSDATFVLPPDPTYFAMGITGRVEIQPHDNVHDNIGGLMSNVPVAASDPIFFVHHCQIDRLWASWQNAVGAAAYNWGNTPTAPSKATWGNQKFSFVNTTGAIVTVTAAGQLSTKALGYVYDELVTPAATGPIVASAAPATLAAAPSTGVVLAAMQASQLNVGSQGGSVTLAPASRPPAAAGNRLAAPAAPAPTTLLLQDVKLLKRPPAPLQVFLNQPAGTAPELNSPYYVGTLNFFNWETGSNGPMADMLGAGASHTTRAGQFRFQVADAIARQKAAGTWNDGPVTVTVSTLGADSSSGETYVTIGKVSLVP